MSQRHLSDFVQNLRSWPSGSGPTNSKPAVVASGGFVPWAREVDRFVRWKQSESPVGDAWIARMRWELLRFPHLLLRAGSTRVPRQGSDVAAEMVALLRQRLPWEKATFALHFSALRPFLAWAENPIAGKRSLWALPSGEPTHRRWLTKDQLLRLYSASSGRERVLLALEGLNGLRRVEVLRLRVKDISFEEGCMTVLGKGRHGGKWRRVPIHPSIRSVLERAVSGLHPTDRVLPASRSGADLLLARAATRSGLTADGVKVSHHDLRRTFGRLAHAAGMDLVQLKNLFGHASLEMTVHYIGLDAEAMKVGLERLSASLGSIDSANEG